MMSMVPAQFGAAGVAGMPLAVAGCTAVPVEVHWTARAEDEGRHGLNEGLALCVGP